MSWILIKIMSIVKFDSATELGWKVTEIRRELVADKQEGKQKYRDKLKLLRFTYSFV